VSCLGNIVSTFNTSRTPLSWSLDQDNYTWNLSAQVNASLSNASLSNASLSNLQFFESPTYPIGLHNLSVTSRVAEVEFAYFVVQNGTLPSSTTSVATVGTNGAQVNPGNRKAPASGVIAGGIISGVLVAVVAVYYFYRRRRRLDSKRRFEIDESQAAPFDPHEIPVSPHSHPVHRKPPLRMRIHSGLNAADLPPSNIHRTQSINKVSTSVINGQLTQTPSGEQDQQRESSHVHLDSGPSRVVIHQDSGVRLNRGILASSQDGLVILTTTQGEPGLIARIGCTEILLIITTIQINEQLDDISLFYNGFSSRIGRTFTNDTLSLDLFASFTFVFARFYIYRHIFDARSYTDLSYSWYRGYIPHFPFPGSSNNLKKRKLSWVFEGGIGGLIGGFLFGGMSFSLQSNAIT
jgi:hypothetical protein